MDITTSNEQQTKDKQLPFVLNSIEIIGLYDSMNYKFVFRDNKLVLLGENGSCKTTLLRIMCYALSGELERLREFSFKRIIISFQGKQIIEINKSELQSKSFVEDDIEFTIERAIEKLRILSREHRLSEYFFKKIYLGLRDRDLRIIDEIMQDLRYGANTETYYELRHILERCYTSINSGRNTTNKVLNKIKTKIKENLKDTVVLYLPTYRRIEKKITETSIYKGDNSNYEEMISFGMGDVAEMIDNISETIERNYNENIRNIFNFNYSSILNKQQVDFSRLREIKIDNLKNIISNIDDSILNKDNKDKLSERLTSIIYAVKNGPKQKLDEIEAFLFHNYFDLEELQEKLEEDSKPIVNFIEVCHKFINIDNKKLFFEHFKIYLRLFNKIKGAWENIANNKGISNEDNKQWEVLSSGEKQIVSIFSKLYLDRTYQWDEETDEFVPQEKKYFVFIDEPELSLSIEWQQLFLQEIIHAPNCKGLVSVSHSPFIYSENELDEYTSSLNMYRY